MPFQCQDSTQACLTLSAFMPLPEGSKAPVKSSRKSSPITRRCCVCVWGKEKRQATEQGLHIEPAVCKTFQVHQHKQGGALKAQALEMDLGDPQGHPGSCSKAAKVLNKGEWWNSCSLWEGLLLSLGEWGVQGEEWRECWSWTTVHPTKMLSCRSWKRA